MSVLARIIHYRVQFLEEALQQRHRFGSPVSVEQGVIKIFIEKS